MGLISNGTTLLDAGALDSGVATGSMTLLSTITASSSSTINFTSGIDSTYKEYIFKFINIHPSVDNHIFEFQGNASGGSGFNETITSSSFSVTLVLVKARNTSIENKSFISVSKFVFDLSLAE